MGTAGWPTDGGRMQPPPSPCINICALDAQGYCAGCFRTGEEIGRWLSMSAAEQWRLIEELAVRRKLRGGAGV